MGIRQTFFECLDSVDTAYGQAVLAARRLDGLLELRVPQFNATWGGPDTEEEDRVVTQYIIAKLLNLNLSDTISVTWGMVHPGKQELGYVRVVEEDEEAHKRGHDFVAALSRLRSAMEQLIRVTM